MYLYSYGNTVTRYSKIRQACEGKKRSQKRDSNEFKICNEWTQEWTSPKRLCKSKRLEVHEVVRGPFSVPKILKTRPFIAVSSCHAENAQENFSKERRGIPDTWGEYLASKGCCGATEARVLQKNLIPCYIRCQATHTLWNKLGLPFVQGIPDPWKSRYLPQRSTRCLRRRLSYSRKSTRFQCNYDGDDEADIEHSVKRYGQFNTKRKKYERDRNVDCNLPVLEEKTYQNCRNGLKKNKKNKQINVVFGENLKLTSPNQKVERNFDTKIREVNEVTYKDETLKGHLSKKYTARRKDLNTKTAAKNPLNVSATNVNKTVQTIQSQKPPTVVCCNCMLQNYVTPNVRCFCDRVNTFQGVDRLDRVLCQDCETIYRESIPRRLDFAMKAIDICVPDPKKCLKHEIVTHENVYKWTKLKLCACLQKAKQGFQSLNVQNCVQTRNTIVCNTDLKFICCRCNCPYMRIVSNATDCSKYLFTCKKLFDRSQKQRNVKCHKPTDCISKYSMTPKQRNNTAYNCDNGCCRCVENKRLVSMPNLEQPSRSTLIKRRNDTEKKNAYEISKKNDHYNNSVVKKEISEINRETKGNSPSSPYRNIHRSVKNMGKKTKNFMKYNQSRIPNSDVKKSEYERGPLNDNYRFERIPRSRRNTKSKNNRKKNDSNGASIVKDEEIEIKRLQYSKPNKNLKYVVSDTSEYADVSDNLVNVNIGVTTQDRSSVTSVSFIRRLNDSIAVKNLYRRKRRPREYQKLTRLSKNFKRALRPENRIILKKKLFNESFESELTTNEYRNNYLDFSQNNGRMEESKNVTNASKDSKARKARRYMRLKHRM